MIRWIPYTFVRTVLFFAGGVTLGFYAPGALPEGAAVAAGAALTGGYFLLVMLRPRRRINPGWMALSTVFLLGYLNITWKTASGHSDHLVHGVDDVIFYKAVVSGMAEERGRNWRVEAVVDAVYDGEWEERRGKVLLYLSREAWADPFRYGDVIVVRGHPRSPEGPANPGEFDYAGYLARRNIYHQHFLRGGEAIRVEHDPPSVIRHLAFRVRAWAEQTLRRHMAGRREQGIATALVLGATDGLDEELLEAYAATGSMHILAVSGLHVSVIYFLLQWFLSPLTRVRGGRWMIAVIALAVLWAYAFITGLPPSVMRAVTMFSFLAIARPWARSTNIYNTLAASALCLLIVDPFLLWSVGFQLSYLAVLGIVFLHRRILMWWEPPYGWVTEIWKMAAVAIAAQVATFPLGLLYFHQFPNYFLLSNLLVVPLSFVVLVGGLAVLAFSFLPVLGMAAGMVVHVVITLLNAIVFFLGRMPFSVIDGVYISPWQCVLLMAFILMVIALAEYRKFGYMVAAFAVIVAYSALQWARHFEEVAVRKLAVYKVPGHSVFDLMDRGHAFSVCDTAFRGDAQKAGYHLGPYRLRSGVARIATNVPVSRDVVGGRLICWGGKTVLQVNGPGFEPPGELKVDFIIIGNNALRSVETLQERVECGKVILDSSNSILFAARFLKEAKLYKLEVHSVWHQGAFITKI